MPPTSQHDALVRTLEEFLAESPNAVVIEDGMISFDLGTAKYAISSDHGKCLLHLWSEERNAVRRVVEAETRNGTLKLSVQKFGQARPLKLEICSDRDRRTSSAKKSTRAAYQRMLHRVLQRAYPGFTIDKLTSAADLEHSFGPAYTRGLLRKGRSAFAVIGVNAQEIHSSIDAALTVGLLWLDLCRERNDSFVVEGLKLFLPIGTSATLRARIANLNHHAAKFHLYEVEERDEVVHEFDTTDAGNIATRLVRCPDDSAARQRFARTITRITGIVPNAEVVILSSTEIAFRLHGLEFARARNALAPGSFQQQQEITFGAGAYETALTADNEEQFAELMRRVVESRRPGGNRYDALWRMQPERWLESFIVRDISAFDSRLDPAFVYSQVPAFAASDRAMIDVLTCTRDGRLAILELKASEDLHLPLQGLDYWARVNWHHQRGEFQKFGYFAGRELSPEPPLLMLVAPALQVHPATDTLLRFMSPAIDCTLIGVDENWRNGVRVIFRKSRKKP
ncbi:MAG: hypothetical protein JWN45_1876 [Acidobacteriaceae bacterium]|nr:hypothetical protein [Acidobacteriaceae bacterium]